MQASSTSVNCKIDKCHVMIVSDDFHLSDLSWGVDHRLLRADPGEHQDGAAERELLAGRLLARHHRPPHSSHSQ